MNSILLNFSRYFLNTGFCGDSCAAERKGDATRELVINNLRTSTININWNRMVE